SLRSMMTPVNNLYRFYGKPAPLAIQYPREINRMTPEMYREAGTFLRGLAEKADTADQPFSYNRHFDDQSKTYYYLTRIKHKDRQGNIIPLRHAHAASDSGETVLEFAKRMNTVLAFNASTQRSPKPGLRKPNGVQIVDGVIIQELPSSAHTLGIKRDN